ncbi:MAG: FAD:protein FMN transferase [Luteolibacter sp.]
MNPTDPLADVRLFQHAAMHTEFTFRFRGLSAASAPGIARLCIELLDTLESQLSRFIDGSDISRINQMRAGETLYLSEAVHQCLLLALDACTRTHGLFDITQGSRIEHLKSGGNQPAPEISGSLTIHPDVPAVTCNEPGRVLDLGGIGKGFALDRLKLLLDEWEVDDALLAAGASSLLAIGPGEWPVDLTGDADSRRIKLCNQALSASGTGIQGSHIVHPYGDEAMPSEPCKRVWVAAPGAALAEVWSTALMLVPAAEIPALLAAEPEITGAHADTGGRILTIR